MIFGIVVLAVLCGAGLGFIGGVLAHAKVTDEEKLALETTTPKKRLPSKGVDWAELIDSFAEDIELGIEGYKWEGIGTLITPLGISYNLEGEHNQPLRNRILKAFHDQDRFTRSAGIN